MSGWSLELRPGWLPGLGAVALASITGAITVADAGAAPSWPVSVGVGVGIGLLVVGLMLGSERVVGIASIPMLVGAAESLAPHVGEASLRPLIIGCLWFVSLELAWSSIERRDGVARPAAVDRQRVYEVSMVVVVTILVGLAATLVLPLAPTRTLLVRGVILGLVLAVMAEAVRRLRLADSQNLA
jgi:hypothetical protein